MKRLTCTKKEMFKSQKGGIGTIIAVLVTTILVLGLISSAILSQVAGAKDTGAKAEIEQQKINRMLQEPNVVTGNTVKSYISQAVSSGSSLKVTVKSYVGDALGEAVEYTSGSSSASNVKDNALYTMSKSYDANGELAEINFVQANLSQKESNR